MNVSMYALSMLVQALEPESEHLTFLFFQLCNSTMDSTFRLKIGNSKSLYYLSKMGL